MGDADPKHGAAAVELVFWLSVPRAKEAEERLGLLSKSYMSDKGQLSIAKHKVR
jgi:hypothetical protein